LSAICPTCVLDLCFTNIEHVVLKMTSSDFFFWYKKMLFSAYFFPLESSKHEKKNFDIRETFATYLNKKSATIF